jgi:hypothetical protein
MFIESIPVIRMPKMRIAGLREIFIVLIPISCLIAAPLPSSQNKRAGQ